MESSDSKKGKGKWRGRGEEEWMGGGGGRISLNSSKVNLTMDSIGKKIHNHLNNKIKTRKTGLRLGASRQDVFILEGLHLHIPTSYNDKLDISRQLPARRA